MLSGQPKVLNMGKQAAMRFSLASLISVVVAAMGLLSTPAIAKPKNNPKSVKIKHMDDIQFGKIAPNTSLSGTVVVHATANNSSSCDSKLTCFSGGDRAAFKITGPGQQGIILTLSNSIVLTNEGGASMTVDSFTMSVGGIGNGIGYIMGNGATQLGVGATLHVNPNQPAGNYTGTFEINASFQ